MPFSPEHPPKLVVFDLDNTLIACDSSQLWIDYLYEEGSSPIPSTRKRTTAWWPSTTRERSTSRPICAP